MTTNVKFDISGCSSLIHKLAKRLALGSSASCWYSKAVNDSVFLKPLTAPGRFVREKLQAKTSSLGNFLQLLSFLLTILLIICFGLPQFANDKSGLAIISLCGLGTWILGWLVGGKQERPLDALDFVVLLYLGANLIAAFSSHYFSPSLKGMAKVVIYIGTYFLFTSVLAGSVKKKLSLLATLVLTSLALSIYGLYQYKIGVAPLATWEDPSLEVQATRIYATLGNPNLLAGFLLPAVPIACAFSAWFFAKRNFVKAIASLLVVALISLATVLTGSRGGYLGLFAGLFVFGSTIFIYVWSKKPKLKIALTATVLTLILAAGLGLSKVPSFASRVESMFSGREHSSNSYRLNVYDSSWKMFKDNWWFGTGTGNETFVRAYGLYMVSGYDALGTYS
ncbi:MAG: O-antigen ligase family protein, partial [Candidatus Obscuribacterales bacterium]|nr:O-antigen ligase family protein [Candidatus Obscuribacterales bacterium]